jgi:hypothetical protein
VYILRSISNISRTILIGFILCECRRSRRPLGCGSSGCHGKICFVYVFFVGAGNSRARRFCLAGGPPCRQGPSTVKAHLWQSASRVLAGRIKKGTGPRPPPSEFRGAFFDLQAFGLVLRFPGGQAVPF